MNFSNFPPPEISAALLDTILRLLCHYVGFVDIAAKLKCFTQGIA